MALLFGIGYTGIIFEESLAFNKSGVGLLMAVSLWIVRSIGVRFIIYTNQLKLPLRWEYHLDAYSQSLLLSIAFICTKTSYI